MASFKDMQGREWQVNINIGLVKKLQAASINILEMDKGEPPLMQRLATDIVLIVDMLYVLCQAEAEKRSVNPEQFAEALGLDSIQPAREALMQALSDFFRCLKRNDVVKILKKQDELLEQAIVKAGEEIDNLDLEAPGKQSTSSQALQE